MILRREKSMVENMKSQGSRQDESLKREGKERRKSVRVCLAALLTRSVTRRWSCDSIWCAKYAEGSTRRDSIGI